MNLFLTEGGVLKLGYYGLTAQSECYKGKGPDLDEVRFFAPEVRAGRYEMKSDVWSLGMALIEMMGIIPYSELDQGIDRVSGSVRLPFNSLTIKSKELVSFLLGCFQWVNERCTVNELMNYSFVKECEEERKEVLSPLVKILRNQEYCELTLQNDVMDAYLVLCRYGVCWYDEGLIERSHSVVMELSLNRIIEVETASHRLLRVNGEEVSGIERARVLDLSDDGERWEGDVLSKQPCGWGVLFNADGEKVYEGFQIGGVNVCYGTRYYSDIQKVEYEGEWFEGKRWGRGIQFDRKGEVVFDGEWMDDDIKSERRVVLNEETQLLPSGIEELIVSSNSCNGREWRVFDLSFMSSLRLLEVGNECFKCVDEVKLILLSDLEKVVIGKDSFTKKDSWSGFIYPDRHFYLKNCSQLKELKIGRYSFSDYTVCEIENVPSLEVIEMGDVNGGSDSFIRASLELKSDGERME